MVRRPCSRLLEVSTGKVKAIHQERRRRGEFLGFVDDIIADFPTRKTVRKKTRRTLLRKS